MDFFFFFFGTLAVNTVSDNQKQKTQSLTGTGELFMQLFVAQCVTQHSSIRKNKVVLLHAVVVSQKAFRLVLELFRHGDSHDQRPGPH